jgi:dipeptidyl aminopeptidase/acylaminoacyl peptidase
VGTKTLTRTDDAALVERVERLAGVGFCGAPSFSPDGSQIAFISDLSGTPQLWTVAFDGGWPRRVTSFPDQVTDARWSPASDLIAVQVAPGGGLNQQIYVVRPDGGELRRLTAGGAENNVLNQWTPDGRSLFIASSRDDASHFDTFLVDVATNDWKAVARTRGVAGIADVADDGRTALLVRVVNRGDADLYLLALDGGETRLTPHTEPSQYFSAYFGEGGVWVATNEGRELAALARIVIDRRQTGALEYRVARDDAELDGVRINRRAATAALLWNVAGMAELELMDLRTGKRRTIALPGEIATLPVFSPDGRRIAFALSGAAAPSDIWVADVAGGEPRQLTRSPHPGVDLAALVRPTLERFKAHDGLELTGWLYEPRGFERPGPIALSFHGGPEGQERPIFNRTYQALLANGIAVFAPNVRGSTGFGKTFVHLDDREKRFDGVRDIQACLDHVTGIGIADPKRVGITGGSYGGYMTMAGITEFPDAFAGAVCVCGIINFLTFFKHTQPWMAAISTTEYGDPETQRDLLEALSPINKIDRAKTPLLVLHGANDTNVPLVEAEQMVDELRRCEVEVDSVIFPDEGHGFTKTANRTRAAVETVRWFAKHL